MAPAPSLGSSVSVLNALWAPRRKRGSAVAWGSPQHPRRPRRGHLLPARGVGGRSRAPQCGLGIAFGSSSLASGEQRVVPGILIAPFPNAGASLINFHYLWEDGNACSLFHET